MDALTFVDSRAFPHCLLGNKPRSNHREPSRPMPAEPRPADGMAELRAWLAKDERWLRLSRWSRGIPALAGPIRARRDDAILHPERMTVDEIDATCTREIPTISREVFDDIGTKALSLQAGKRFEAEAEEPADGTIGEAIGAEALGLLLAEVSDEDMDPLWADALEYADDNLDLHLDPDEDADETNRVLNVLAHTYVREEIDALREHMAARYGVAYDIPHPDVRDRIEWEQFVARCGETRRSGFRILPNRVEVFHWDRDDERSFAIRKQEVIDRFLSEHGLDALPPLAKWHERRRILRAMKTNPAVTEPIRIEWEYALAAEQARASWTDDEAGMSGVDRDEPYIPSLALLTYQHVQAAMKPFRAGKADWNEWAETKAEARAAALDHWQSLRRSAPKPTDVHRCRNPRNHGGKDEMWRAEPPESDIDAPVVLIGEVA